ncbi:DUF1015 domain-containing protein [Actinospica sp. MGRD01-02]|uniref:DUF1015 domain-containing protein n=1 Tax=Actinospica acidithermotolerans TaxID=2828514 RepID=A0A941EIE4_9ACTN|nr:DUF1015 domain-containing protein [Actinospica acidithermotolerans]MBR7831295.1 DUF1015 domain-containing protein [Actinospica acidithermotolerans]
MTAAHAPDTPGRLVLSPFRGLRFTAAADRAAVISPPYDMIDPDRARALASGDAHNIVRVILPELDEPDPLLRYRRAARTLRDWRDEGLLALDPEPALYVYEQVDGEGPDLSVQRGLIGALLLPSDESISPIHPHEDVVGVVVQDRRSLMYALGANPEPILLTYQGGGPASDLVERVTGDGAEPVVDVRTADGVRHRLWAVTAPEDLAAVGADLAGREALIADGHHRYAAYRELAKLGRTGSEHGLALLVDSSRHPLRVRGIHRWLPDLRVEPALREAEEWFTVRALDGGYKAALQALGELAPTSIGFALVDGHKAWLLSDPDEKLLERYIPADRPEAWRRLDATVLHYALAGGVWSIPDTADHIRFDHDPRSAVNEAYRHSGVAVLLRPVAEATVLELAAAGQKMPRKSTSFSPKPATGLVLRLLDES